MKDIIIQGLLPVASTLITALVSMALVEVKKLTAEKLKNEKINAAMDRVTHTVQTTVDNLTQTLAIQLKDASENGKLTATQARTLKQDAAKTVLKQLPDATKAATELAVTSINALIGSKIEQALLKQSFDNAMVKAVNTASRPKYPFPALDLNKLSSYKLAQVMGISTENTKGPES